MTENTLAAFVIISLGACLGLLFFGGGTFIDLPGASKPKKGGCQPALAKR